MHELFSIDNFVCANCMSKMNPKFKEFKIQGVCCLAIYSYKDLIKEMIFRYKGCLDYELRHVFISMFYRELKFRYRDYVIVPVPSSKEAVATRGFSQVYEVFKELGLPVVDALIKTEDVYLHNANYEDRKQKSKEVYRLKSGLNLKGKKVLLVDDVCTTGSSLTACVSAVETVEVTRIQILVISKRDFTKAERKKLSKNYQVLE